MPISTNCPMCGHNWQAPDQAKGRNIRCPECLGVYGLPGAPSPTAGSQSGAARPTSPSSQGVSPRPATAKSHAGAPVARPGGSSQGVKPRPATSGSHSGKQAIDRSNTDTPSPFSSPTANMPAPPPPAPRPEPEAPRRRGSGVAILGVMFLIVLLAGGGIGGLILLKKSVNPTDNAVAKADDTKPSDPAAPDTKAPTTAEKKPAPTTGGAKNPAPTAATDKKPAATTADKKPAPSTDKKPTTEGKGPPDTKVAAKDPPKPPDGPKPPEPKPAKPTGPRDGELVNVVNGPMVLGSGQLTVVSAGLGTVPEAETKDKYLIIKLSLKNASKNDSLDFQGWGVADPVNEKNPPRLFDSMGNEIKRIVFPVGKVLPGQTLAETIKPGVALTDVLVFAVPPADSLYVKLVLPGPTESRKGSFRALIPAARYQEAVVTTKPDPKPNPKPDPKPDPEKKPEEPVRPGAKPPAPPQVQVTPEIAQLINKELHSQKPEERLAAIDKLAKLGDAAVIPIMPVLMPTLFDGDPKVREAMAVLLEKLMPKADGATAFAVGKLAHTHFDGNVRQVMFKWLGQMDPKAQESAIPDLAAALTNPDPKVQLGAVHILAKLGEKALWALPEIASAASAADNDEVRGTAVHMISEFGPKAVSVVPVLATRVSVERVNTIRAEVVKTLGLIGPGAAPALADLKTALQDTDPEVQKLARESIKLIETK